MELFDLPARLPSATEPAVVPSARLAPATHAAVFGGLPASLARALDTTAVAAVVTELLDAGWRAGQLASRIGALPAGADPAADVLTLLGALRAREAPDRRWQAEKAARQAQASSSAVEQPATPESRERWIRQIRDELGAPHRPRPAPAGRVRPPCALCGEPGDLFVTRAVRLCTACVTTLETGQTRLVQAG